MLSENYTKEFDLLAPEVISKETLKLYAEASGDHNSIHQDEELAKSRGLPGVLIHGMLMMGLVNRGLEGLLKKLKKEFPKNNFNLTELETRFTGMGIAGDKIYIQAQLKRESDTDLFFDIKAQNENPKTLERTQTCHCKANLLKS